MTIPLRIWFNPAFQALWQARWETPAKNLRFRRGVLTAVDDRARLVRARRRWFEMHGDELFFLLMARLGRMCFYCRKWPATVLDHAIPLCWGGTNDLANLVPCCDSCNRLKGNKLPREPIGEVSHEKQIH